MINTFSTLKLKYSDKRYAYKSCFSNIILFRKFFFFGGTIVFLIFFYSESTYKTYGNPTTKTSHEVEKHILDKAQSRVSV